ncbi:MAG: hypothetical protein LBE13_12405 [Bacteroidales bacterium]|nr:hypothetical protein [Bacteroidales bacterium]
MNSYVRSEKENIPLQRYFLLIIFVCCIVKIWNTEQSENELWIGSCFSFLYVKSFVYKLITCILFCVNIFLMTIFLRQLLLISRYNYHVSFLYMLLCFVFPQTLTLWGMIVGVFFITGIFLSLFNLTEINAQSRIFMYGILCGLLSLIYMPCIFFLSFFYIVMVRENLYHLRLFVLPLAGVMLVYLYLFSGFYLFDRMDMIYDFQTNAQSTINIALENMFMFLDSINTYFFLFVVTILLGLFALFSLLRKARYEVVYKRKKYYLLLILLLSQSVFMLFFHIPCSIMVQVLIILLSILICMSMLYAKRKRLYIIFYLILFGISFYINFLQSC